MKGDNSVINISNARRILTGLIVMLLLIAGQGRTDGSETATDTYAGKSGIDGAGMPPDGSWSEVPMPEKLDVLRMLVDRMTTNFGKLRTWSGVYTEHSRTPIPSNPSKIVASGPMPEPTVRAEFKAACRFRIDLVQDSCFLSLEDGDEAYYELEGDAIAESGFKRHLEQACVLTPEHYLELTPAGRYHGFVELKGHDLPPKRALFRRPPARAGFSCFSNFFDPRVLFHLSATTKTWGEFENSYIPCLQGDHGSERKSQFDERLLLSRAEQDGVTWYRAAFLVGGRDGRPLKEQIYSSDAGFNRTHLTAWKGDSVSHRYTYTYREIDGIYVPEDVMLEYNGLTATRHLTLEECVLNRPIDASQFSYEALGIEDGDLIMDDIEQVAYQYKSGEPEKLANYGEGPPKAPADTEQADSPSRMIYVWLGLAVLIGVVVAVKMAARR